ncbi:MAG TPA: class I SAM-dependent methyltransferase [Candidatus Limnocylindria bacterium]|nr:class I SAM-dependent methyltransferase [Candidatus Limnocylindria bacterium]
MPVRSTHRSSARPRTAAVDAVAAHNERMWDRLARAGIPYTRPQGRPPRDARGKRRFLDELTYGHIRGIPLAGKRVLSLAGGGGWDPILFAELGAETTLFDLSPRQLATVRALARERGTKLRFVRGDMRDLSAFGDGEFDLVYHHHSLVFVPDAARVVREVARVLAPGGIYVFSTMHPVTLRMYETWTGTGWGFKQRYDENGPVPVKSPTWEFDDVKVEAPTLEYAHRISDLVNACVRAKLVVDGLWEWSPGDAGGEPGSDDELERYLPAFIAIRARRLDARAARYSPRRTATRSR